MWKTSYHIHVKIDWELERMRNWEWTVIEWNFWEVRNLLEKAKQEWKTYRSWCDNMLKNWSCGWHSIEE